MLAGSTFDAGPVFTGATPTLSHTFHLRNTTGRPIQILAENHSCDCTDVSVDERDLQAGESCSLVMNVRVPPCYTKKDVSCVVQTDSPVAPEVAFHLRFEAFPDARITPDRIDLGEYGMSQPGKQPRSNTLHDPEVWLEVFSPAGESGRPVRSIIEAPEACSASLDGDPEVSTPATSVRMVRRRLRITLRDAGQRPGVFVKPLNVSLGGGAGASAVVVWTVRSVLSPDPPSVHFGMIGPEEHEKTRSLAVSSSDGVPFRIISIDAGDAVRATAPDAGTLPSSLSTTHRLSFAFRGGPRSSRFAAGSLRVRTDRADCPELRVPWSAFLHDAELGSSPNGDRTGSASRIPEGGASR
jgi:hypothetical protein